MESLALLYTILLCVYIGTARGVKLTHHKSQSDSCRRVQHLCLDWAFEESNWLCYRVKLTLLQSQTDSATESNWLCYRVIWLFIITLFKTKISADRLIWTLNLLCVKPACYPLGYGISCIMIHNPFMCIHRHSKVSQTDPSQESTWLLWWVSVTLLQSQFDSPTRVKVTPLQESKWLSKTSQNWLCQQSHTDPLKE